MASKLYGVTGTIIIFVFVCSSHIVEMKWSCSLGGLLIHLTPTGNMTAWLKIVIVFVF